MKKTIYDFDKKYEVQDDLLNEGALEGLDERTLHERVENGKVYTIEGNSNDSCAERNYDINSSVIVGYGTPMY